MNSKKAILTAVVAIGALSGCGDMTPFQAVHNEKTGALVINRYTGATYRVVGDQLLELTRRTVNEQKQSSMAKTLELGVIPNTTASFQIGVKYLDNKMLYIIRIRLKDPADKEKRTDWDNEVRGWQKQRGTSFIARFYDESGFAIGNVDTDFADLTRIVDSQNIPFEFKNYGEVKMSAHTFEAISTTGLEWRL